LSDEDKFIPINLEAIRPNCPFTFDLYIKVNEKYLHYIRKGDAMEEDQADKFNKILKLKEKDVERLFMPVEDEEIFEEFIDDEIEEAIESEELEPDDKFKIIEEIALNAVEVAFSDPNAKIAFQLVEKAAKGLRKVVQANPKVLKDLFKKRGRKTDKIEDHCKNVASLSVRLGFLSGLRGKELDDLGAAGLVHNIGLKSLKQDEIDILFTRPYDRMKPDDKRIYHGHVEDGVKLLEGKKFSTPEILLLVERHGEKLDGSGFPKKLTKLTLQEQVLSLCNAFDKMASVQAMGAIEALKNIRTKEVGKYDLKLINRFKTMLEDEGILDED